MTEETAEPRMKIAIQPVTPFQQNSCLIWCTETMRGAFTDPGGETDRLLALAEAQGVTVEKILITHGHMDHAGGAADLAERLQVPIEGPHPDDAFWLESLAQQGAKYGMTWCRDFTPDRWLQDGDTATVGNLVLDVYHCPGHTPGHVVFHNPAHKVAIVGDVLFQGSIGRTDFPRGDHQTLLDSITQKLWPLGEDMRFVPGHGNMSSFGQERKMNPYVSDSAMNRA